MGNHSSICNNIGWFKDATLITFYMKDTTKLLTNCLNAMFMLSLGMELKTLWLLAWAGLW